MTPLQPGDDRAADRDDSRAGQPDHETKGRIRRRLDAHMDALSHIAECRACRFQLFSKFLDAQAQLAKEVNVEDPTEVLRRHIP